MRFKDKSVIVTGAARGIGRAIALGFAREGASVTVADIRQDQGEETARLAGQAGGHGFFAATDVSRPEEVQAMVSTTLQRFNSIDVLVNVAGICPFRDFLDMPVEVWDQVLDINLRGVFLCSQAAARVMVERGTRGRIVNISSISAIVGGAQQAHYTASKAGINLLTASMAISLGPHGITCNAVLPGPIETDINKEDLQDDEKRQYFIRRTPLGRIGQPEDVVGPVLRRYPGRRRWHPDQLPIIEFNQILPRIPLIGANFLENSPQGETLVKDRLRLLDCPGSFCFCVEIGRRA
jgi:L-rhamnose 1-dehydrogenase